MVRDHGMPEDNPGFWASLSANTYLHDLSGPLQLHHGGADHSVPLEMSQTLAEQIRQAGGATELYVYPGDNHDIANNLGLALARSVAWFDRYVKA
jgi:dipeptidyl aminopeptidase/acylaminoacyl peptidase